MKVKSVVLASAFAGYIALFLFVAYEQTQAAEHTPLESVCMQLSAQEGCPDGFLECVQFRMRPVDASEQAGFVELWGVSEFVLLDASSSVGECICASGDWRALCGVDVTGQPFLTVLDHAQDLKVCECPKLEGGYHTGKGA